MTSIRTAFEARRLLLCYGDPVIRLGLQAALADTPYGRDLIIYNSLDDRLDEYLGIADVTVSCYEYGLDICARLRNRPVPIKNVMHVVVIARRSGERDICAALAAGVKGYLMTDCEIGELIQCIGEVSHGARHLCNMAANRVLDSMSREMLTTREIQVLRCLMNGHVNKRISDELQISIGTVKSHVKSIFTKLGVATRTQAVNLAAERGILLTE
jgi:DNA-binding NarL/FixJ family response regulator